MSRLDLPVDQTLETVQFKFASIIGELCGKPSVLSQFAVWLDLRLAEYKTKGAIQLDCTGFKPNPDWLSGLKEGSVSAASLKDLQRYGEPQQHVTPPPRHVTPPPRHITPQPYRQRSLSHRQSDPHVTPNKGSIVKSEPRDFYGEENLATHFMENNSQTGAMRIDRKRPSDSQSYTPLKSRRVSTPSSRTSQDTLALAESTHLQHHEQSLSSSLDIAPPNNFQVSNDLIGKGDNSSDISFPRADNPPELFPSAPLGEVTQTVFPEGGDLKSYSSPDPNATTQSETGCGKVRGPEQHPFLTRPVPARLPRPVPSRSESSMTSPANDVSVDSLTTVADLFHRFLKGTNLQDQRMVETIPPVGLDNLLCSFYHSMQTDGESLVLPEVLFGVRNNLCRYLLTKSYPENIITSKMFAKSSILFNQKIKCAIAASKQVPNHPKPSDKTFRMPQHKIQSLIPAPSPRLYNVMPTALAGQSNLSHSSKVLVQNPQRTAYVQFEEPPQKNRQKIAMKPAQRMVVKPAQRMVVKPAQQTVQNLQLVQKSALKPVQKQETCNMLKAQQNPVIKPEKNLALKPVQKQQNIVKPDGNPFMKQLHMQHFMNPVLDPSTKHPNPNLKPGRNPGIETIHSLVVGLSPVGKPVQNPVIKPVQSPLVNQVEIPVIKPVQSQLVNQVEIPVIKPEQSAAIEELQTHPPSMQTLKPVMEPVQNPIFKSVPDSRMNSVSDDKGPQNKIKAKRGRKPKPKPKIDVNIQKEGFSNSLEPAPFDKIEPKRGRKPKPKIDVNIQKEGFSNSLESAPFDKIKPKRGRKPKPKIDVNIEKEEIAKPKQTVIPFPQGTSSLLEKETTVMSALQNLSEKKRSTETNFTTFQAKTDSATYTSTQTENVECFTPGTTHDSKITAENRQKPFPISPKDCRQILGNKTLSVKLKQVTPEDVKHFFAALEKSKTTPAKSVAALETSPLQKEAKSVISTVQMMTLGSLITVEPACLTPKILHVEHVSGVLMTQHSQEPTDSVSVTNRPSQSVLMTPKPAKSVFVAPESQEPAKSVPKFVTHESQEPAKSVSLFVTHESQELAKSVPVFVTDESQEPAKPLPLVVTDESQESAKSVPVFVTHESQELTKSLPVVVTHESQEPAKTVPVFETHEKQEPTKSVPICVTHESQEPANSLVLTHQDLTHVRGLIRTVCETEVNKTMPILCSPDIQNAESETQFNETMPELTRSRRLTIPPKWMQQYDPQDDEELSE